VTRFLRLLAGVAAVTAAGSLLLGLLARAAPLRSLSVGFYSVGAFLVLAGLAHFTGRRRTPDEHHDSLVSSVLFVALGLILVVLGTVFDRRYPLA
jgi:uncharacterized membrane protein HdeD (DUF308 family)